MSGCAAADLDLGETAGARGRRRAGRGRAVGLPYIAASADISSPKPMLGVDGRPLAESLFRWIDPKLEYWRDRAFALRAPFVFATRLTSEPFYFQDGRLQTWRPTRPGPRRWARSIRPTCSACARRSSPRPICRAA
jgi:hypothetical protein